MLIEILWSPELRLQVDNIHVAGSKIMIQAHGTQVAAYCPDCHVSSTRGNGRYYRHPADLPCVGYAVEIRLAVPRFFCDNGKCPRRTFSARFPELLQPYSRRTNRLTTQHQQVGFTISAETGSRLSAVLGMLTSPDTLLRLVRLAPEANVITPRVLGVDDWAYCKGRSYGTILIDLEKHEVIDLLEDRSAESLAAWLQDHPGVEIITRDRGPDYIEGATTGAPEAIQIADRFHLMQNVADSLKRTLQKQTKLLREAARRVAAEQQQIVNCQAAEVANSAETETDREQTLQELRFAEVKRLQAQKWSCRSIAKHLNIDRRTVGRYFAYETYPKRIPGYQSISKAAPYESYLARRWQEGCQNIKELHTELEAQGFKGSYGSVRRAVKRMLKHGQLKSTVSAETISVPRLSVTEATWLLLHQEGQLNDHQRQLRDMLCQISPDIERGRQLAQSFCQILRERKADELDQWLVEAEESAIGSLKNFATGLRRDYDAVKAAATYEWSNGQTEGQINRLKCIKRQMYGRAKFDLLRKRVLGMPAPT